MGKKLIWLVLPTLMVLLSVQGLWAQEKREGKRMLGEVLKKNRSVISFPISETWPYLSREVKN